MNDELILLKSEYEKLLQEITFLRAEIVRLTTLRDDLVCRICPALRAIYEEEIGSIERQILAAQIYLREKQRIIENLQAQINRQEQVSFEKAQRQAADERKEFEEDLNRRTQEAESFQNGWRNRQWSSYGYDGSENDPDEDNHYGDNGKSEGDPSGDNGTGNPSGSNTGGSYEEGTDHTGSSGPFDGSDPEGNGTGPGGSTSDGTDGSEDENLSISQKIKRLYRKIMKRLHPDVRPNQTEHEKELFGRAQAAYERGDLEALEKIWKELEGMEAPEESFADTPEDIEKMRALRKTLTELMNELKQEISSIRAEFPYTIKDLLENEELLQEKRNELEQQLRSLREANDLLAETIEKLREKLNV